MDGRRAPQGLDAEDRIALGLTAPRLFYLLIFSMAGWGLISSHLPFALRIPPGVLLLATGGALAWGRIAGRPLDRWAMLYAAYLVRPRRSVDTTEQSTLGAQPATDTKVPPEIPQVNLSNVVELPLAGRTGRHHRARRVVLFSLRGGTGKSALASELAAGLAAGVLCEDDDTSAARVALLDLDLRASTLCISMGLQGPTLGEVGSAAGIDAAGIERSLLRHDSGARVMLAPPRGSRDGGHLPALAHVLSYLDEQEFDFVVLDAATGLDELSEYAMQAADEIYYVFTASAPGVYDLYRGVETLRRLGHRDKIRYVANHCAPGTDLSEVLGDLRGTLSASLPFCAAIGRSAESHRSAVLDDLATARALRPLALAVRGETAGRRSRRAAAGWDQVVALRR